MARQLEGRKGVRMTVKRTSDPLGVAPDSIEVDDGEGDDVENAAAWREFLKSLTVEARIERCKRHSDLIPQAEALRQRALDMGAATGTGWMDWQFRAQYENLERAAAERDNAEIRPLAERGNGHKVGSASGGKASAKQRRENADDSHAKWVTAARKLLASGKAQHELSSILATRFEVGAKQMRTVLQGAQLVKKRK
jgi:hypothetical protein